MAVMMMHEGVYANPAPTLQSAPEAAATERFTLEMESGAAATRLEFAGAEPFAVELVPDKTGEAIVARQLRFEAGKWKREGERKLVFQLVRKEAEPLGPGWPGRVLAGMVRREPGVATVWLEGQLLATLPGAAGALEVKAGKGAVLKHEAAKATEAQGRWVPVELGHLLAGPGAPEQKVVEGVPFEVRGGEALSLAQAGWPEWEKDPGSFYEAYDAGARYIGDPRLPLAQAPKADYVAAHLLAHATDDPGATSSRVVLRAGRRLAGAGVNSQVALYDFGAEVPRGKELQVVRIPFTEAFAHWIEGDVLDLELTKELRLAVRSPDPCRFRWRPLGLPSGVKVAAVTLEKSPLQFQLTAGTEGSLFEGEAPHFTAGLQNITPEPQPYRLEAWVGGKALATLEGSIPAGEHAALALKLPALPPGHYEMEVRVANGPGAALFSRKAMFGVLPADVRQHRAQSPLGTWQFEGTHFTPHGDYTTTGPLYRKLGLRYGLFGASPQERAKYGVLRGNEYAVRREGGAKALEGYAEALAKHPDTLPSVLLFHEDSISGPHVTRVPDFFHDRRPYQLNDVEKTRFAEMMAIARESAQLFREKHPEVQLSLGNGPLPLREEFYRAGFPKELFDSAGNEAGAFGRPPETQPPDPVANNASLWMDRQMLDAYGYGEKSVSQCYEIVYPGTNPGNLSYQTQADYFVRHILHSLAWEIPRIRIGGIVDVGNSYYFSNWGSSSFFTARPSLEPKPAAVALATLTSVLDGATFEASEETGSDGAYLLRFRRKDGNTVLVSWVVRGERELRVTLGGKAGPVRVVGGSGVSRELEPEGGAVSLPISATPQYLVLEPGATVAAVALGEPRHDASPRGEVSEVAPLASLEGWKVAKRRNPVLEIYNPMTPRRKGDFLFEPKEGALRVTPQPLKTGKPTMPMVVELRHEKGLPLPGKPTEIGLWVNGNSGWGRIIYEVEDASGQRWTSIGAKAAEQSSWMADWLPKEVLAGYEPGEVADWNTDDVFGLSRINFDGWRYVGFPLPGQYEGEGFHWPANSQWKASGDGFVRYPLKLRKVIVEMPEKVLHVKRFESPKRGYIELKRLVVAEDARMQMPKAAAGDYVEAAQNEVR